MTSRPPSAAESTVELLRRVGDGEDAALELLYRRYLTPLRRWARGRLPTGARPLVETDDLVQETLVASLRHLDRFDYRHPGAFEDFLRHALLNKVRDQARRVGRLPLMADADELRDPGPSPLEETIGHEVAARFDAALARLKPAERSAVFARVELHLSYEEVARVLDKPSADAARMAVTRAIARLAEEMSRDGEAG